MTEPDICGAFRRHVVTPDYVTPPVSDEYQRCAGGVVLASNTPVELVDEWFAAFANEMRERRGIAPEMHVIWMDSGWSVNIAFHVLEADNTAPV